MLQALDKDMILGDSVLGGLTLEFAGLSKLEQNLVLTSTSGSLSQSAVELALLEQHHDVHNKPREQGTPRPSRWQRSDRSASTAYVAAVPEGDDDEEWPEDAPRATTKLRTMRTARRWMTNT